MINSILQTPPEPLDIKKTLRTLYEAQGRKAKYIVFAGNQLPKYLWDHWSEDLHRIGLKWQDILRSLSRNSDKALAWISGEISWKEFIDFIIQDLLSQTTEVEEGKGLVKRKVKTLTDFL